MARDYKNVVKALFAKANAEGVSPAEKKALEDKAYELMEVAHIQIAKEEHGDRSVKPVHYPLAFSGAYHKDQALLFNQIASHYGCIVLMIKGQSYEITGYESDIEQTELLYSIIEPQMFAELANVPVPPGVHARKVRNAFVKGYIIKIKQRLDEIKNSRATQVQDPGNAIVLRSRELNVRDYLTARHPRVRGGSRTVRYGDRDAFAKGQEAAARAQFHLQTNITGSSGKSVGTSRKELT